MPSAEDFYNDAVDCVADGKLEDAVSKYRQALEADPEFADAWEGLSMALADREQWDEAIEAAHKVVDLAPDEQLGYTNLSRIYQRAGKVPEAEEWAAKARVLDWKVQLGAEKK